MLDKYRIFADDYERLPRKELCRKYNVSEQTAYNLYLQSLAEYEEELDLACNLAGCGED